MSLDVYLMGDQSKITCEHCNGTGICIEQETYFEDNITHNLNRMAEEAGLYKPLWHPEDESIAAVYARDLIQPLRRGLLVLTQDISRLKQFNPENGWGSYDTLLKFTKRYLEACETYPDTIIQVSR